MGQLRDIDQMVPGESVQHLTTANTTLKRRFQQVTQESTERSKNASKAPAPTSASPTNASPTSKPKPSNFHRASRPVPGSDGHRAVLTSTSPSTSSR